jgi:hypothetical protein
MTFCGGHHDYLPNAHWLLPIVQPLLCLGGNEPIPVPVGILIDVMQPGEYHPSHHSIADGKTTTEGHGSALNTLCISKLRWSWKIKAQDFCRWLASVGPPFGLDRASGHCMPTEEVFMRKSYMHTEEENQEHWRETNLEQASLEIQCYIIQEISFYYLKHFVYCHFELSTT